MHVTTSNRKSVMDISLYLQVYISMEQEIQISDCLTGGYT